MIEYIAIGVACYAAAYTVTDSFLQRRINKKYRERLDQLESWATSAGEILAALGMLESLRQGNEAGIVSVPKKPEETKH